MSPVAFFNVKNGCKCLILRSRSRINSWNSHTGSPLLQDALASLDCHLVSTHEAGDHTLFVGEVIEARVRSTDRPLTSQELPYVYLGGKVLFDQASRQPLGPE
jgi:flavin reductase (DIM6/NTAB) family NADH-FMN oxidoreductase RutF